MGAVPPGSYLALSHPAADIHPEEMAAGAAMMNQAMSEKITFRTRPQLAALFGQLELVEPGLVPTTQWRPGPGVSAKPLPGWVGVARKP